MAWTRDMYLKVYGNLNETIISYYIFFLLFWNHFTQNFLTIYNASLDFELLFKIIIFVSSGGKKHKLAAAELKKNGTKQNKNKRWLFWKKSTVTRQCRENQEMDMSLKLSSFIDLTLACQYTLSASFNKTVIRIFLFSLVDEPQFTRINLSFANVTLKKRN